jgi:hypothetical protein
VETNGQPTFEGFYVLPARTEVLLSPSDPVSLIHLQQVIQAH